MSNIFYIPIFGLATLGEKGGMPCPIHGYSDPGPTGFSAASSGVSLSTMVGTRRSFVYVIVSILSVGFPGILIYLALWVIMPESTDDF